MNWYKIVSINDTPLEVIRDFTPTYFVTDRNSNQMNQKLIGLWGEYLGGDRVVRKDDRILICKTIEEVEWEEVN